MFDELVNQIESTLKSKKPIVVGISGFGGSGKTTLTQKLCNKFDIADSQVVHLDNIFAQDHANKPIFQDYDWDVITELLKGIPAAERLAYQGRGFFGESITFNESMPDIVVVEGVRLYKPDVMPHFDIAVWIDCPIETATERGVKRDRESGADEAHIARWAHEWEPKDQVYYDQYRPDQLANFLYQDYK